MHFVRTPILVLVFLGVISSLAYARPGKSCKYWCKEEERYYCCPTGKKKGNLFSMAMSELLDTDEYPWLLSSSSWMHYLLPIVFQRTASSDIREAHPTQSAHCPDLRPSCPRSEDWYNPPAPCDVDEDCGGWEKCCYDICLDHKTCKPSVKSER